MLPSTHLKLLEALCDVVTTWLLLPELLEPCTSAAVRWLADQWTVNLSQVPLQRRLMAADQGPWCFLGRSKVKCNDKCYVANMHFRHKLSCRLHDAVASVVCDAQRGLIIWRCWC